MPVVRTPTKSSATASVSAVFPVSDNSPFADGYDIDAEREALSDMTSADDVDQTDPRYPRFVELERRESELIKMRRAFTTRDAANSEVPDQEAMGFREMGKLTISADDQDSIDIHTLQAARLFLGREIKPGEKGYAMTGGKKVASCLRIIWHLSSNDNPYADYALILAVERMDEVRRYIDEQAKKIQKQLQDYENQGIRLAVLRNPKPYSVNLGFGSPYGYSVIMLINRFDYYVRLIRTLVSKSILNDREGRDRIYDVAGKCRSIFEEVEKFQRILNREKLRTLSRLDFLPTADVAAKTRVTAVVSIFGELPREVFNGQIVPRHSKRKINLSAAELKLLDEVPLGGEIPSAAAEALL